ncbi:hypothetical protein KI387_032033, partial [Taxus chinensis]
MEYVHLNHGTNQCPLLQRVIRKNVSSFCKTFRSTTHDTGDCRLIGHIHDSIDIGVRQTSVTDNSKGNNEHKDQDYNQARYDRNDGRFEGGRGRGRGYRGGYGGQGRGGGR